MRGRRRTSLAFLNRWGPSCRIPFGVLTSSGWHHILSPLEGPLLQDERIVALRRFAVLKALSDAALHEVERKCRWRNYGAGDTFWIAKIHQPMFLSFEWKGTRD